MNASRNFGTVLLLGLVSVLIGIALLVIFIFPPGSPNNTSAGANEAEQQAESPQAGNQQAGNQQAAADQDQEQQVNLERAKEIALNHIGEGEVTWTNQENDHGARWEIEVTRTNGNEANVYVAANGEVTHVSGDSAGGNAGGQQADNAQPQAQQAQPAPSAQPAGATIDAQQAGQIAAAHVGGTVDTVHRESGDHGAAWDVDVYSDEGEYIVYVSAAGEVTHVEGPFNW